MDGVKYMRADKQAEAAILREENLKAREHYKAEGLKSLMSIMCLSSIQDWVRAEGAIRQIDQTRKLRRYPNFKENERKMACARKKECEVFFDSDIFLGMTGMDCVDDVIKKLQKIPIEQVAEIGKRMMSHG